MSHVHTSIIFLIFPDRKVDATNRMGRVIPDLDLLSSIFDDAMTKKRLHLSRIFCCIECGLSSPQRSMARFVGNWTGHSTPDVINTGFFVHVIAVIQLQGIPAMSIVTAVRLESEWSLRVIVRVRNHEGIRASLPPALFLMARLEVRNLTFLATIRSFTTTSPGTGQEVAAG